MPKMADKSFLLIDINELMEVNKSTAKQNVKNVFLPIVHGETYTEYDYRSIENFFENIPSEFRKIILYGSFKSRSIASEFFTGTTFIITKYKDDEKNMISGKHNNDKNQKIEFFSEPNSIDLDYIENYILKLRENKLYDKYVNSIKKLFNIEYEKNDSLVKRLEH